MELDTDDDKLLQTLAQGKAMDLEKWPSLLSRMITRLEKITLYKFPRPKLQTAFTSKTQSPNQVHDHGRDHNDQTKTEENTAPNSGLASLPPPLHMLLSSITGTLFTYFSKAPPHTIQRLAELLHSPCTHYRTLSSYLHALDRVVHVTSPTTHFPLPPIISDPFVNALHSNGSFIEGVDSKPTISGCTPSNNTGKYGIGSDEALGGALLTPITWLKKGGNSSSPDSEIITQRSTEIIEGPNGPGGVETVSVSINGVSSATTIANTSTDDTSQSSKAEDEDTKEDICT